MDNANVMIGELRMATGQINLGHVAAGAVVFGHWAGLYVRRRRRRFGRIVAGETFHIVRGRVVVYRLMRIVAGKTTDPRVIADEAFADFKAIRLKAHEGRAVPFVAHHGVPGAMTLAAEIGDLFGVETLEHFWEGLEVFLRRVGHVPL